MARIHAIEIHEQDWCPAPIRDAATDYLQFASAMGSPYRAIAGRLADAVKRAGTREVLDLCSGAGGPWFELQPLLSESAGDEVRVRLSDLHPNRAAFERAHSRSDGAIEFIAEPVSALAVPRELPGFRTMFAAFHHFRSGDARRILADAVASRRGIAVLEPLGRGIAPLVSVLFAPLACLLVTPFIRPFRWSRLLFTYLVPVVPLVIVFDGVVSCLRTYTPDELRELVDGLDAPGYRWDIGTEPIPRLPAALTYLIGTPEPDAAGVSS